MNEEKFMKEKAMFELVETMERLEAVAEALEQTAERIAEHQVALAAEAQESVGRIVATVESAREVELEHRLAEAEAKIVELKAAASAQPVGRTTLSAGMAAMFIKQGVALEAGSMQAGAVDSALSSLSIEQRIAVKSELFRAGLLA